MLKEVKIENFKCLNNLTLSRLERINLIGGRNNGGKTTLLEAIWQEVSQRPLEALPDISTNKKVDELLASEVLEITCAKQIIVRILDSVSKTILIDNIENGIHHTSHRQFWRLLFELAVELDVQIFATTHSLEMLEAFTDVGLELNYKCSSAYFEMAKKWKTDQIIGIRRDLETLDYALKHKEGVRGE